MPPRGRSIPEAALAPTHQALSMLGKRGFESSRLRPQDGIEANTPMMCSIRAKKFQNLCADRRCPSTKRMPLWKADCFRMEMRHKRSLKTALCPSGVWQQAHWQEVGAGACV